MKNSASSRKKPAKKVAKPLRAQADKKAARQRVAKTPANDETCLQKHCKQWLDKSGLWPRLLIFHVANERKGGIGTAMHFKRVGVRPGVADWLLFLPGRAVAIELKDDKGAQDKNQEVFQKQWEAAGNAYFIARTLEEFQGIIAGVTLFVPTPPPV